ncbi:MAG: STAS domain-containing protein, partial [Chromatocurvus sp.]
CRAAVYAGILVGRIVLHSTGCYQLRTCAPREIAGLTKVVDITGNRDLVHATPPEGWKVIKIRGALFFAAADRISEEIFQNLPGIKGVVLHMQYCPYLDAGGLTAIERLMVECEKRQVSLRFSCWQFQPLKTLARARSAAAGPLDLSFASLDEAVRDSLDPAATGSQVLRSPVRNSTNRGSSRIES